MKTLLYFWFGISILVNSAAEAPRLIPFQGRVTDAAGKPIPDGTRAVQFQIFGQPTGGTPLWAGEVHRVTVNGGLVNVMLGTKYPFPADSTNSFGAVLGSFFDQALFLEVRVDSAGNQDGTSDGKVSADDPPLLPRQPLLPVVYALESGNARKLQGHDWSSIFGASDPPGTISGSKFKPGTLDFDLLAPDVGVGILGVDSALLNSQPLNPDLQRQGYVREISPLMAGAVPNFIYRKGPPGFLRLILAGADETELVSGRSTRVNFDWIAEGLAQAVLTLRNLGNGVLNGLAVTVDGGDGTQFSVSVASPNVAAGDTTAVTLVFKPLSGDLNATVHVQAAGVSEVFDLSTVVAPVGMAFIPAGSFQMGDTFSEGDGAELPVHSVYVSAFYMDKHEVTKALWDEVKGWSAGNGYGFDNPGAGKAANHPVQTVDWYDVVKWCNARSEKEGRVPAYYNDAALTQVYKTGQVVPYVKWDAGYRLPTEAEWEKAARGRASGHRFPWSDADTITHSRANYYSDSSNTPDISPTRGFHPTYKVGGEPYTSPVGSFAPNGYGFYDMAGNVFEWCWDWYGGSYSSGFQTDPRGPGSGSYRVVRGGSWISIAFLCRSAIRIYFSPENRVNDNGFRSALPPGQP